MSDLSDFLMERIAEDEAVLTRSESFQHSTHGYDSPGTYSPTCPTCRQFVWGTRDRALAECEAKRRIVKRCSSTYADDPYAEGAISEDVLHALALPYASHPDYRDEWRPYALT